MSMSYIMVCDFQVFKHSASTTQVEVYPMIDDRMTVNDELADVGKEVVMI